jgi:hypothetical protein
MPDLKCAACGSAHVLGRTPLVAWSLAGGGEHHHVELRLQFQDATKKQSFFHPVTTTDFVVGAASVCLECGQVALHVSDSVKERLRQEEAHLRPVVDEAAGAT